MALPVLSHAKQGRVLYPPLPMGVRFRRGGPSRGGYTSRNSPSTVPPGWSLSEGPPSCPGGVSAPGWL